MANLVKWIEGEAGGEEIEGIVIGEREGYGNPFGELKKGEVVSWVEAKPLLDYEFRSGYGGVRCHAVTAWTASKVIFVSQYDGSTMPCQVPRHPVSHCPIIPGG